MTYLVTISEWKSWDQILPLLLLILVHPPPHTFCLYCFILPLKVTQNKRGNADNHWETIHGLILSVGDENKASKAETSFLLFQDSFFHNTLTENFIRWIIKICSSPVVSHSASKKLRRFSDFKGNLKVLLKRTLET